MQAMFDEGEMVSIILRDDRRIIEGEVEAVTDFGIRLRPPSPVFAVVIPWNAIQLIFLWGQPTEEEDGNLYFEHLEKLIDGWRHGKTLEEIDGELEVSEEAFKKELEKRKKRRPLPLVEDYKFSDEE